MDPRIIHERMINVYGVDALLYFTIQFWCKQFQWDRESIQDDQRCGIPVEARTN
jgi:hypothetical protein